MKALAKIRPGIGLDVIEAEYPRIMPHEVIIKVGACGVCGNDVKLYRWEGIFPQILGPHLPLIIGHEFAGKIVEIGPEVQGFELGQLVAVEVTRPCGRCYLCVEGKSNICINATHVGADRPGGMAEYVAIPADLLIRVPDGLSTSEAALLEPLSVAVHGLERMPIRVGNTVAVVGLGAIGLLMVQAAKATGANRVIALGTSRSKRRLELARVFGADDVVTTDCDGWSSKIVDMTSGRGVDQAFEVAGPGQAVLDALQVTRKGGQVCIVGASDDPPKLQTYTMLRQKELDVFTARGRTSLTWERALTLVASGKVQLGPLTKDRVALADAPSAIDRVSADRDVIKLIIEP